MKTKQYYYDRMCALLTDYEQNKEKDKPTAGEFYDLVREVVGNWETVITAQDE